MNAGSFKEGELDSPTCGSPPTIEGVLLNSPVADGCICTAIFYIVILFFSYVKITAKLSPSATASQTGVSSAMRCNRFLLQVCTFAVTICNRSQPGRQAKRKRPSVEHRPFGRQVFTRLQLPFSPCQYQQYSDRHRACQAEIPTVEKRQPALDAPAVP